MKSKRLMPAPSTACRDYRGSTCSIIRHCRQPRRRARRVPWLPGDSDGTDGIGPLGIRFRVCQPDVLATCGRDEHDEQRYCRCSAPNRTKSPSRANVPTDDGRPDAPLRFEGHPALSLPCAMSSTCYWRSASCRRSRASNWMARGPMPCGRRPVARAAALTTIRSHRGRVNM